MSPADLAEQAELGEAVAGRNHQCCKENGEHRWFRFWCLALLDRRREGSETFLQGSID